MSQTLADIEKLVAEVAKDAVSASKTLQEKMDALKLLQPYYAIMKKAKPRPDDDDALDEPTMGDMRDKLRLIEQETDDGGVETADRRAGRGA